MDPCMGKTLRGLWFDVSVVLLVLGFSMKNSKFPDYVLCVFIWFSKSFCSDSDVALEHVRAIHVCFFLVVCGDRFRCV